VNAARYNDDCGCHDEPHQHGATIFLHHRRVQIVGSILALRTTLLPYTPTDGFRRATHTTGGLISTALVDFWAAADLRTDNAETVRVAFRLRFRLCCFPLAGLGRTPHLLPPALFNSYRWIPVTRTVIGLPDCKLHLPPHPPVARTTTLFTGAGLYCGFSLPGMPGATDFPHWTGFSAAEHHGC